MIQSSGVLVKAPTTLWEGTSPFNGWPSEVSLTGFRWASYAALYRQQLWVSTVVNKLAMGTARLPLKVYERDDMNRPDASASPYGQLLRRPNQRQSAFDFWLWVSSTYDIFGEAFVAKRRDAGGRPVELIPLHPTRMHLDEDGEWTYTRTDGQRLSIDRHNLVIFKTFNAEDMNRGMSKLEPLRRTLEFEDAAQRSQSSFWRNGARPGVALTHPGNLSTEAGQRLKLRWDSVATGADKTGSTVVLEEGMKAEVMTLSANEAQYIDSRKLNREEVCGGYDVPPPAVHILDKATFSNITEQLRSLYRDTMAPRLQAFEGVLETDLRSSRRPGASDPDFSEDFYAEFLLDEVLRGDFEKRAEAYAKADYMTIAEKRRAENLPFIEGTDRIFVNAATVPLDAAALNVANGLVRSGYDAADILRVLSLPAITHTGNLPVTVQGDPEPQMALPAEAVRSLMGRIARCKALSDVDGVALVDGYPEHAQVVLAALTLSTEAGHTLAEFRTRLKAMQEADR